MHSASLYRGIPFIRGLLRSVSPRRINKQQLEVVLKGAKRKNKKNRLVFYPYIYFFGPHSLKLLVRLIECLTTLIKNVTENRSIINFDDNWLLWLRNMVSKVTIA